MTTATSLFAPSGLGRGPSKSGVKSPDVKSPDTKRDELVVAGLDSAEEIFQQVATIELLDGADCAFLCPTQPKRGSSLLLQFNFANGNSVTSHGEVIESKAGSERGSYRIEVKLDPGVNIEPGAKGVSLGTAEQKPSVSTLDSTEPEAKSPTPLPEPQQHLPATSETYAPPAAETAPAPTAWEIPEEAPDREASGTATASAPEWNQRLDSLKKSLFADLVKVLPAVLSADSHLAAEIARSETLQTSIANQTRQLVLEEFGKPQETLERLGEQVNAAMSSLAAVEKTQEEYAERTATIVALELNERLDETRKELLSDLVKSLPGALSADGQLAAEISQTEALWTSIAERTKSIVVEELGRSQGTLERLGEQVNTAMSSLAALKKTQQEYPEQTATIVALALNMRLDAAKKELFSELVKSLPAALSADGRLAAEIVRTETLRTSIAECAKSIIVEEFGKPQGMLERLNEQVEKAAQLERRLVSLIAEQQAQIEQFGARFQDMQNRLDSAIQSSTETLKQLTQCEKTAQESAKSSAADFEREIKAVLLRLGNTN